LIILENRSKWHSLGRCGNFGCCALGFVVQARENRAVVRTSRNAAFVAHYRVMWAVFSFLYLKKIKFQKYMSVFKYFKNIPRSPSHRATGPMCNFFFQICNEVPGEKKKRGACRPPQGRQAPVARWGGDRVLCFSLVNKAY